MSNQGIEGLTRIIKILLSLARLESNLFEKELIQFG